MTRPSRFLFNSSSTAVAESPQEASVKSDFSAILTALLCALVCLVGLLVVVHYAWLRHRTMANRIPRQPSAANKGIKKKLVEAIRKFTYDSAKEEKGGDCVICLVEYADGDNVRVLPQCGHRFHIGCIDKWLGSHSSCPSCRQIVVIGKCKSCSEYPTTTVGETTLVAGHEGREINGGASLVNKVEGN